MLANGAPGPRLLPAMDSPPPKRHKSESSAPSSVSDDSRSRYYHSQSVGASEHGRSRQTSTAMDIYVITDRDPEKDRRTGRWTSNGSSASHASQTSYLPAVAVPSRKYPERYPPIMENGRSYQSYRKGIYMLPCDEEEQNRLDIFHKVLKDARKLDGLVYAPHSSNGRILDLGCGTGIWCIDMAEKYPDSFVVGVDLAPIQPVNMAKNLDFYAPFDFESPWTLGEDSWDLIHMQMSSGSVVSWINLYRRILAHLRPGAWFEQVEIDFEPRCDHRSLSGTALRRWYQALKEATDATMRPIAHSPRETESNLKKAGFIDIQHQIVGLPLNPWHPVEQEREVGRCYNIVLSESIETMSLAPLTRVSSWTVGQIQKIADEVRREARNRDIQAYNLLYIYQARKPVAN